jgi:hypothetical protein
VKHHYQITLGHLARTTDGPPNEVFRGYRLHDEREASQLLHVNVASPKTTRESNKEDRYVFNYRDYWSSWRRCC